MSVDTQSHPDDYVVVQPADPSDAAVVASLSGHENVADYVSRGLHINTGTMDWDGGTFDVSEGEAYWLVEQMPAETTGQMHYKVLLTAHYGPRTALSFDPASENWVWADLNGVPPGTPNDAPKIRVTQTGDAPTDESFLIATLDGSGDTNIVDQSINRNPDGIFEALEADEVVIKESLEANGLIDTSDLADGAVTNPKVGDSAIDARTIEDGEVGSAEIGADEVGTSELAPSSVVEEIVAERAIVEAKLAVASVYNDALQAGIVTHDKIAEGNVRRRHVADGTINTPQLAGRAVTPSRIDARQAFRMAGLSLGGSLALEGASDTHNPRGSATNEVLRVGGPSSDSLIQVQSGGGRLTWTWNAEHDDSDDVFRYIEGGEPAMGIRMHGGRLDFWTADGGAEGAPIDWEAASVDDGGISNAHALDHQPADAYLRKHGVVDITKGELTLLQDERSSNPNTSHDVVFENTGRGNDRVHLNYARPELRAFEEPHFRRPAFVAHKLGHFRPGRSLELLSVPGVAPPRNVGARFYYFNGEVRAINDAGKDDPIHDFYP